MNTWYDILGYYASIPKVAKYKIHIIISIPTTRFYAGKKLDAGFRPFP